MAKLSKDEFIAKFNDKLGDNEELKIELMEDITDSLEDNKSEVEDLTKKLEEAIAKYDELLARYKERFMNPEEVKEVVEDSIEEEKEEEVVDIQDIFEEE